MKLESWNRLNRAITHYQNLGFEYVDVPWYVQPMYSRITKPYWCDDFPIKDNKVLVGSAEQSFLQEYSSIGEGIYYAITPCFRDELAESKFTKFGFLKLELFAKGKDLRQFFLESAWWFFFSEVADPNGLSIEIISPYQCDIVYNRVELGSYSINSHKDMSWVCGTGLAEPRFTAANE